METVRLHDERGDVVRVGRVDYVGHTSIEPEQAGTEYAEQAATWLEETDSTLEIELQGNCKYFPGDKETRDVYQVTLKRRQSSYAFTFGQSINRSEQPEKSWHNMRERLAQRKKRQQPSAYSVLACLDGYSPGTFEDFCGEFGYDIDSRSAEATWKSVLEQWLNLDRMYSREELAKLSEIS